MPPSIGEIIEKHNIKLETLDPVVLGGFTQVPNFILKGDKVSPGAKIVYAMFLHYAWNNDHCFPGQERLAKDIGQSQARVSQLTKELEVAGLVEITRRGQGQTNLYKINFTVKKKNTQFLISAG